MELEYFSSHGKRPFYSIIYTHLMKFVAESLIRNPSFDANWTILFPNFRLILHHILSYLLLYVYLAIPFAIEMKSGTTQFLIKNINSCMNLIKN